jgi:hypothetical protein
MSTLPTAALPGDIGHQRLSKVDAIPSSEIHCCGPIKSIFDVDKSLSRQLKPHQVEAVAFIVECLSGKPSKLLFSDAFSSLSFRIADAADSSIDKSDTAHSTGDYDGGASLLTGAILADEVFRKLYL